jgi:23S rRNA (cytidine1920-2'-O)/16S rRNA (cytidine1409-2'-O)-methyltransferase
MRKSQERVDILLVRAGLAESRTAAARLVMAGAVRAGGQTVWKASQMFPAGTVLHVDRRPRFVSRGGEKLEAGLEGFGLDPSGRVCADVGSSTGGFTDCLLQRRAARVYAIDVGRGQLHWSLRNDARVRVMEQTNARYLTRLPEAVSLVTVDASFISLGLLVPVLAGWLEEAGDLVALVKPQFEAGRKSVGKGGVVQEPQVRRQVLVNVSRACASAGLAPLAAMLSPLRGPKGNVELLLWCRKAGRAAGEDELLKGLAPDV